jgi:alkylation response protein AidB-like acyl-CoA dehydrogenase
MQESQAVTGDTAEAQRLLTSQARLHGAQRCLAQAFAAIAVGENYSGLRRQFGQRKISRHGKEETVAMR